MSTLVQKLVLTLGAVASVIVSWLLGRHAGSRQTRRDLELEQKAGQVETLKEDVVIDQQAAEAKREIEQRPVKPPMTKDEAQAVLARLRKKFP